MNCNFHFVELDSDQKEERLQSVCSTYLEYAAVHCIHTWPIAVCPQCGFLLNGDKTRGTRGGCEIKFIRGIITSFVSSKVAVIPPTHTPTQYHRAGDVNQRYLRLRQQFQIPSLTNKNARSNRILSRKNICFNLDISSCLLQCE